MAAQTQAGMPASPVDVLTVGESLGLVMGEQAAPMRVGSAARLSVAGAEGNVAIGLARLGHSVAYGGRVGDDLVGRMITDTLRGEGVDVSSVVVDTEATTALMVRQHRTADAISVVYYRDDKAGSRLCPDDLPPMKEQLSQAKMLHVTGITPGLSASARAAVAELVVAGHEAEIVVSLDVNHRRMLWSSSAAGATLAPLLSHVTIVFGGDEELLLLADGIRSAGGGDGIRSVGAGGSHAGVEAAIETIRAAGPRVVVRKRGGDGASAYGGFGAIESPALAVTALDPVGAGDAFVAGFLSGMLDDLDPAACLARGMECGAFCVSSRGDWEGAPRRSELGLLSGTENVLR